jgi:murein DD-endopeptidase MepM/ murein hydrolase activator NlpD
MGRLAAWLLATAVVAVVGCASPHRSHSLQAAEAPLGGALPQSVTIDDGKGVTLDLRLAGVVEGGELVSRFGMRKHPMGGGGASHAGIDIKAPRNSPVRPAADGVVVERAWGPDFGRFVRIRHGDRMETVYAHLTRFTKPLEIGQVVTVDDVIGYVGSTGRSTGPHVHFEVRRVGKPIDPLNTKPASVKPERKTKPGKAAGS